MVSGKIVGWYHFYYIHQGSQVLYVHREDELELMGIVLYFHISLLRDLLGYSAVDERLEMGDPIILLSRYI
jgi:hypothetical protein